MRSTHSSLLRDSALLAVVAGMSAVAQSMPAPRKCGSRNYSDADIERSFASNPLPKPMPDAAMHTGIAAHNAEVDRRKTEKKARKAARGIVVA